MARRPSGLLDLPAYEGAARVARFYLDRAGEAARRLEKKADPEALHDFRVSLRRLRSNLQAHAPYLAPAVRGKQRKRLRELASSTGDGRDAEVQLAWLERRQHTGEVEPGCGVTRLRARLEAQMEEGYRETVARATRTFGKLDRKLRERLAELEAAGRASGFDDGARLAAAIARRLPEYAADLDVHLSRVHRPTDEAEAHRARIRAKRLRYLLEPIAADAEGVGPLVERLEELQDLLGELRDVQLLGARVRELLREAEDPEEENGDLEKDGLHAVADRLSDARDDLFQRLADRWLGGRGQAFFAAVDEVAGALVSSASIDAAIDVEIERKYLLSGMPEFLAGRDYREIDQGYLPGERLQERVRRVRAGGDEWYVRTVKVGSGVRRIELQEDADRETFEVLWPLTRGRRVQKHRYRVAQGGLLWEVDRFTDRDLVLAEVELPSEDVRPALPDWLAPYVVREVTGEEAYVNINLAR